jgi:hypothetical protein
MSFRRRRIDPNSPGIKRKAARYERKLRRVLLLAARVSGRRDPVLARLYREAKVEGVNARFPTTTSVIAFETPPFRGGLYEMYDWSGLDGFSEAELAASLAWAIAQSLKDKRKGRY